MKNVTTWIRNNKFLSFILMIVIWQVYRMITSDHVKIKVPEDGSGMPYYEDAKKLVEWISPNVNVPLVGSIQLPKWLNGEKNDDKIVALMLDYRSNTYSNLANVYKQICNTSLYEDLKAILSKREFEKIQMVFG